MSPHTKKTIWFFMTFCMFLQAEYITMEKWGGRFGDQLLYYVKLKWLAQKYNGNFLLRAFKKSERLALYHKEEHYQAEVHGSLPFKKLVNQIDLGQKKLSNVVWEVPYFYQFNQWYLKTRPWVEIIQDKQFIASIKELLQPVYPVPTLALPKDHVTVAVHIRTGGGVDAPCISQQWYDSSKALLEKPSVKQRTKYADWIWPLKFLPCQYYVDQIKRISGLLNDAPLYVYVFTDDRCPDVLCKNIAQRVDKANITYAFHGKEQRQVLDEVDDLFIMAHQFDVLIRGGSHLALIADLIGSHKIVIRPVRAYWFNDKLVVTKTDLVGKDHDFVNLYGIGHVCSDGIKSILMT